jgi:hypothetical protein
MTMIRKLIKTAGLMAVLLLLGSASVQSADAFSFHCVRSPGGVSCYFEW